jgi:ATP-binding cassette subfamily F protein 3
VFSGVNFIIERGDRVALVGVNGAGKSTLIKLLAGTEALTAGEYRLGHNAQPDYFAQDQYKELDQNARMIDDLGAANPRATQTELRSLLGCFLFSEDDVFKPIRVLSGGERNRYALARMLTHPSNFLLLDEPTNHLDMRAKDVLLESLQEYTGTIVFVSHDRYFIDKLATRVFEIGNGAVTVYPGNYEDYLWRKQGAAEGNGTPTAAFTPTLADVPGLAPRKNERRVNPQKLRQMEARCQEVEQAVATAEAEIAAGEAQLSHFVSAEESVRLAAFVESRRAELAALMKEWEELSSSLEAIR